MREVTRSEPSFRRKPEPRSQSEAGPFLDEAGLVIWVLTFVRMTVCGEEFFFPTAGGDVGRCGTGALDPAEPLRRNSSMWFKGE